MWSHKVFLCLLAISIHCIQLRSGYTLIVLLPITKDIYMNSVPSSIISSSAFEGESSAVILAILEDLQHSRPSLKVSIVRRCVPRGYHPSRWQRTASREETAESTCLKWNLSTILKVSLFIHNISLQLIFLRQFSSIYSKLTKQKGAIRHLSQV